MIKNKFKFDVGFSDHTIGTTAAIVSVSLGATVIEKHFTTSKNCLAGIILFRLTLAR